MAVYLSLNNLFRPEILADPYPFYHTLRSQAPVHWEPTRNSWVLTRYCDVQAMLADSRLAAVDLTAEAGWLGPEDRETLRQASGSFSQQVLFSNPPEHTRMRGLLQSAFSAFRPENLRPRIQAVLDALLDKAQACGRMDFIHDVAKPLPVLLMAGILGVPEQDHRWFKAQSEAYVTLFSRRTDQLGPALRGYLALREYFQSLTAERRANPGADLVSALIAASGREQTLSEEELLANCVFLSTAGLETTSNLLGNGLLALLRHPDQLHALRNNPALIVTGVEELLRYDAPVQSTPRVARADLDLGRHRIRTGQSVLLFIGAANRDPAQFAEPDRLELGRQDNRHLSFSAGRHFCLGAALARVQAQVALSATLKRFPSLRLGDINPSWEPNPTIRGLKTLPVVF